MQGSGASIKRRILAPFTKPKRGLEFQKVLVYGHGFVAMLNFETLIQTFYNECLDCRLHRP
jgi:hypothetical protein